MPRKSSIEKMVTETETIIADAMESVRSLLNSALSAEKDCAARLLEAVKIVREAVANIIILDDPTDPALRDEDPETFFGRIARRTNAKILLTPQIARLLEYTKLAVAKVAVSEKAMGAMLSRLAEQVKLGKGLGEEKTRRSRKAGLHTEEATGTNAGGDGQKPYPNRRETLSRTKKVEDEILNCLRSSADGKFVNTAKFKSDIEQLKLGTVRHYITVALKNLVARGELIRHGNDRSTYYTLAADGNALQLAQLAPPPSDGGVDAGIVPGADVGDHPITPLA